MAHLYRAAARLPKLQPRDSYPPEERDDWDFMNARINIGFGPTAEMVDGLPYGVPHFTALTLSPPLAAALSRLGRAQMLRQGKPGTFSQSDHELIDLVLCFDSDYWCFMAGHTPGAVAGGVRIEAIEALRDRREDLLTDDERQVVEFIRAVRDRTMTDESYFAMAERLGSERGAMELVYFVCSLVFHHLFCWSMGVPEMERPALDQMLQEFRNGTREIPSQYNSDDPRYAAFGDSHITVGQNSAS